jgi:predicted nucleotidyltransferase
LSKNYNKEIDQLFFINFSGFMALKSEFAPDFFNYMLKNKQIAIFNECFYLNSFDPKFLVPKSELVFKNLISNFNKASKILRLIPGVKAFSLCNSLALKTFHKDSDVDLFIILDSKTFFTTRILIILVFTIFRLRPLVCLSFFVSERNLNLRRNCYEERLLSRILV